MNSAYTPKPGTIPARVIEHLTATGGTMTRAAIANGFAIEPKNVDGNLATCIKHGLIVRHQVEGQKTCYGLPGSTPGEDAPVPAAHLTMMRSPNSTILPPKKVRQPKPREVAVAPEAVPAPAPDAPPPPIAALWEDGDVVLYGLQINADDTVTLTGHQAQRVHRFMERCFGPNE